LEGGDEENLGSRPDQEKKFSRPYSQPIKTGHDVLGLPSQIPGKHK
jgi:hypothetical protein